MEGMLRGGGLEGDLDGGLDGDGDLVCIYR